MSSVLNRQRASGSGGQSTGAYTISQSCRFNDDDSAYLSRTPGSAGNRKTWTWAGWVKRGNLGVNHILFSAGADGSNYTEIRFRTDDTLEHYHYDGAYTWQYITSAKYRDPSAWYHIVWAVDTTQGTGTDRAKLYVNGSLVADADYSTSTDPSSSMDTDVNTTSPHRIGSRPGGGVFADGYMADVYFIDGTQYAASDFGEFDTNGNWVPINPSVTYGTNGFHLDFADSADLGNDVSGNANDYTSSGLATNDQVTDSPTDDAANDVGNYCVMNPLDFMLTGVTLSDGNLRAVLTNDDGVRGTIFFDANDSDGYYFEMTVSAGAGNNMRVGVCKSETVLGTGDTTEKYVYISDATKIVNAAQTAYGATFTAGDIIGVFLKAGTLEFFKNNVSQGNATTGMTGSVAPLLEDRNVGSTLSVNFGQQAFTYTPPTGAKTLCSANLPAPAVTDPSQYFQVDVFTGTGAELARTLTDASGAAFKPDLIWLKNRDTTDNFNQVDSVRGATLEFQTSNPTTEATSAQGVKSFDTSGYTLGTDVEYNTSSEAYSAWLWFTEGGAGSSNTDGSINTTTTSVNTTSGVSLSTFTGTGANATVGHGLGVAPKIVIVKERSPDATNFFMQNTNLSTPADNYLLLDQRDGVAAGGVTIWNSAIPTSTVFSLGTAGSLNGSTNTYVAWCFAEVEGFSKFGLYEGNANADGPFVWCGFRPAFVLTKNIDTGGAANEWCLFDESREGYNVDNNALHPNRALAEITTDLIDITSNGFKLRGTTLPNVADTHIFLAFAEHPFGGDGVSQARAR